MPIKKNDDDNEIVDVGRSIRPTTEDRKDQTRHWVTIILTVAVVTMPILTVVLGLLFPASQAFIKDYMTLAFTGLIGVYGTAAAFYFKNK